MRTELTTEMYWLGLTSVLTAVLWVPYLVDRIAEQGAWITLSRPQLRSKAPWAERLMRAHANAVENLTVFAPVVLLVQLAGANTATTGAASMTYFFARLAHAAAYTVGVPVVRTLAFAVGFACQAVFALTLIYLD